MCGRYYFDDETSTGILKIIREMKQQSKDMIIKTGEIYPTQEVPILVADKKEITPQILTWGLKGFGKNKLIINARSESVFDKRMFRESIIKRRCIIPANGFYEWNQLGNKKKYYFTDKDADTIYMAGLYDNQEEKNRFVILTTKANKSMHDIHDRMPFILRKEQIDTWFFAENRTHSLLNEIPIELQRKEMQKEYEQISFDFLE